MKVRFRPPGSAYTRRAMGDERRLDHDERARRPVVLAIVLGFLLVPRLIRDRD